MIEPFVYKRKTDYQGKTYLAGESRPKDCEMDGDKFAEMLHTKVFPAIRSKMAEHKKVTVQWDNAGGHGMSTLMAKIHSSLNQGADAAWQAEGAAD